MQTVIIYVVTYIPMSHCHSLPVRNPKGIKRKRPGKKALQAAAADYTSEERTFVDA